MVDHSLENLHDRAEQMGLELTATQRSLVLYLSKDHSAKTDRDWRYSVESVNRWCNEFARPGEYQDLVDTLIAQADLRAAKFDF